MVVVLCVNLAKLSYLVIKSNLIQGVATTVFCKRGSINNQLTFRQRRFQPLSLKLKEQEILPQESRVLPRWYFVNEVTTTIN